MAARVLVDDRRRAQLHRRSPSPFESATFERDATALRRALLERKLSTSAGLRDVSSRCGRSRRLVHVALPDRCAGQPEIALREFREQVGRVIVPVGVQVHPMSVDAANSARYEAAAESFARAL